MVVGERGSSLLMCSCREMGSKVLPEYRQQIEVVGPAGEIRECQAQLGSHRTLVLINVNMNYVCVYTYLAAWRRHEGFNFKRLRILLGIQ